MKLNTTGRALLKSHHKLAVRLTATSGTTRLHSQTVTFKEAKKISGAAPKSADNYLAASAAPRTRLLHLRCLLVIPLG